MITVKFTTEKIDDFAITPAVLFTKERDCTALVVGWLKKMLIISFKRDSKR